jgi:hypothetical protein
MLTKHFKIALVFMLLLVLVDIMDINATNTSL